MFNEIYSQVNREKTLSMDYVFYTFRNLPITLDDLAMAYLIRNHYIHLKFDFDMYLKAKIWEVTKKHSVLYARRYHSFKKNRIKRLTRKMSYLEKEIAYLEDIRQVLRFN